jgi:ubiquinone/menaquinone biosynthesis C-methylase UbiE
MLLEASRAHPDIEFEEGHLDDLPISAGALAGAVCWYSTIYIAPERLDEAFAELGRVLEPGGHLLLAFQLGHGEMV